MAGQPPMLYDQEPVGTAVPSTVEIDEAYDLLLESPYNGAEPIDVALYFVAAGAGAFGDNYRKYSREWPVRANPLIVHFFSSTQTTPAGDTTAWCAAFMNWCLLRSKATKRDEIGTPPKSYHKQASAYQGDHLKRYSTNSAATGSFRCWKEISAPQRGDLVVFKDKGTDNLSASCRGTGHVAFFQSFPRDGYVRVIGGNQSDKSGGAITVANMAIGPGSRFMKYVGLPT
jgi:hypothetical protein